MPLPELQTQEPVGESREIQGKRNAPGIPRGGSAQKEKRVRWASEVMETDTTRSTEEYVIDPLVDEGREPKGRAIYRVRRLEL